MSYFNSRHQRVSPRGVGLVAMGIVVGACSVVVEGTPDGGILTVSPPPTGSSTGAGGSGDTTHGSVDSGADASQHGGQIGGAGGASSAGASNAAGSPGQEEADAGLGGRGAEAGSGGAAGSEASSGGTAATAGAGGVDPATGGSGIGLSHAALLERRTGYARTVTGAGLDADQNAQKQVWVSNTNDSGAGSLRSALSQPNRWIRFSKDLGSSFKITLQSPLTPAANITLDGRGTRPILATAHNSTVIEVKNDNQIFVNLDIVAGAAQQHDQADCFNINGGAASPADNIWIHHVSMTGVTDKRVGISFGQRVTVDWSDMYGPKGHGILVGCAVCSRADVSFTTVHHNYFHGLPDRQPRVSFGHHVHAYNNVCVDWVWYAMGAVDKGELLAENNWFSPKNDLTAIKASEGSKPKGLVKAVGNVLNGGTEEQNAASQVFKPSYSYSLQPATAALRDQVKDHAGWQPSSYWTP